MKEKKIINYKNTDKKKFVHKLYKYKDIFQLFKESFNKVPVEMSF